MGTAILIDREATKRGGPTSGSEWASGPTTMTALFLVFVVIPFQWPTQKAMGFVPRVRQKVSTVETHSRTSALASCLSRELHK